MHVYLDNDLAQMESGLLLSGLTVRMLLLLLLLTNQISEIISPTSIPACIWNYQWSNTTDLNTYLPNNDTSCDLYSSDTLSLVNADKVPHMLYKVSEAEFASCNSSSPIHSVSIPAGSTFDVTIFGGDFQLSVLSSVYMISEKYNEGCLQLAFSIKSDTIRDCNIGEIGGVCSKPRETPSTNVTNFTNVTNVTNPTDATDATDATMATTTQVAVSQSGQLSAVEIFLVVACCFLALADIAAIGVLIFLCLYLPSGPVCSREITRGPRGRGQGDRGAEMKEGNISSWRQKKPH